MYERSLAAFGAIMQFYDPLRSFPLWGFGDQVCASKLLLIACAQAQPRCAPLVTRNLESSCNGVAVLWAFIPIFAYREEISVGHSMGSNSSLRSRGCADCCAHTGQSTMARNIKATAPGCIPKCHDAPLLCNCLPRHIWQLLHMPTTAKSSLFCHS